MLAAILLSAIFALVVLLLLHKLLSPRETNLPPSPRKLPLIGNLHQLGPAPHQSLRHLSRSHGPLMLLHLGSVPTLIVSSAEAAREVMKTHDLSFASRPVLSMAKHLFYDQRDLALAPYGQYWRQARRLCTLHLLSARKVQSYGHVREEEVANMVAKIWGWCKSGPVNLSEILNSLSNEIISRVALGRKYFVQESGGRNEFCGVMEELSALLGGFHVEDFFPWLGLLRTAGGMRPRVRRCSRKLDRTLHQVLEEHRAKRSRRTSIDKDADDEQEDFVDVLLSLREDDGTPEISLADSSLKAIILDMFAAGTDTSFVTLEWTMSELLRNPEVMKKVQAEVRGIAKSNSKVSESETSHMDYLDAIIKEALRLHPPLPLLLPRESISEVEMLGYNIPSHTRVLVNVWAMGRDERYWEEPEEFKPERFVGSGVDYKGQDFKYLPFGSGRRVCPGISFATSNIKIALANLLYLFDWEMPGDVGSNELDMEEAPGLTTRRKIPLVVVAKPHVFSSYNEVNTSM